MLVRMLWLVAAFNAYSYVDAVYRNADDPL